MPVQEEASVWATNRLRLPVARVLSSYRSSKPVAISGANREGAKL